jgi:hypothetical protein
VTKASVSVRRGRELDVPLLLLLFNTVEESRATRRPAPIFYDPLTRNSKTEFCSHLESADAAE